MSFKSSFENQMNKQEEEQQKRLADEQRSIALASEMAAKAKAGARAVLEQLREDGPTLSNRGFKVHDLEDRLIIAHSDFHIVVHGRADGFFVGAVRSDSPYAQSGTRVTGTEKRLGSVDQVVDYVGELCAKVLGGGLRA